MKTISKLQHRGYRALSGARSRPKSYKRRRYRGSGGGGRGCSHT